ncbi:MAG: YebC/PmpR family DNA-binding transcriptional regulator [Planctomycetota bacterium]|nr:MAG: YebC/PmpR family DNA-binding transcriptional regulator [Planctomycetota bacterium]
MAGHSHWARIKRAKAVTDARRGKAWSKLSRAIIIAARSGGADPAMNLTLRYAIDAAKAANMPKDTIERAIKKGAGDLEGAEYVELVFEGYGPGGAAILCTAVTDNRNRTAPEVKRIFERHGGKLGASGSVAWMFAQRGVITVPGDQADEEKLTDIALECGADDIAADGDVFEIQCDPAVFEPLRQALADAGITPENASISKQPSTTVAVSGDQAEKLLKLIQELEDHDDVQDVYGNYELSVEDMERFAG